MGQKGSCCDVCMYVCMFSSNNFIVSGLTFGSLFHFEFIFVYGVRECSNFILLHVAVWFSQHHLLKRLSLLHSIFWPPLTRASSLTFTISDENGHPNLIPHLSSKNSAFHSSVW